MSVKKAQKIVNDVDSELGINFAGYQNSDLEFLKKKLEEFLDLEIDTEELEDAQEFAFNGMSHDTEDESDDLRNIEEDGGEDY
jgi:hypothetical protein